MSWKEETKKNPENGSRLLVKCLSSTRGDWSRVWLLQLLSLYGTVPSCLCPAFKLIPLPVFQWLFNNSEYFFFATLQVKQAQESVRLSSMRHFFLRLQILKVKYLRNWLYSCISRISLMEYSRHSEYYQEFRITMHWTLTLCPDGFFQNGPCVSGNPFFLLSRQSSLLCQYHR